MSTITLPNIRVSSDLTVSVRLKDNGVAIDWSTLNNVKASIYSDAQRALAGRCDVSVDAEDPTVLVCQYAANKPQYVGVCRIVVSAKYMGETKTYDKPAFNFVRWTADQDGEQITIDDPDVDVEIDVADVSSSLLDEAIRAAFTAAEEAVDAKGQVLETEAEVEAAEALRVSAEESRVEAEEGRAEAEAARVDEEAVRVSAEDARVVAENARAAAEDLREGAEDDRAAAETARETAEAARVAAEALRVTAEGSRETAEAAREAQASADHTVAAGDHTQAAADHTQVAADHTTAASDHTQAGADHTLAAADHVTAGEDHAQAQDDHEVMAGYDTRLGKVEGEVSQLEAEVADLEDGTDELYSLLTNTETETTTTEYPVTWQQGICAKDGTINGSATYSSYCSPVSVLPGDILKIRKESGSIEGVAIAIFVTAYSNGVAISAKGEQSYSLPYTVPDGIDEVRFTVGSAYTASKTPVPTITRETTTFVPKVTDALATTETKGLMSPEDKAKIDLLTPGESLHKNASLYGFLPSKTGVENAAALTSCLQGGGNVVIDIPGTYKIARSILIPSNTSIYFGAGVIISKVEEDGASPRWLFINENAPQKQFNENIQLIGLHLQTNGLGVGGDRGYLLGQMAHICFYRIKNLVIDGYVCTDATNPGTYQIQVTDFDNVRIENCYMIGQKDGIHFGAGKNFAIRHCTFLTNDDAIALNAQDYPAGVARMGWIEDGVIEDIHFLAADSSYHKGRGIYMLGGSWLDWASGNQYRKSGDAVVSGGKIYRTYDTAVQGTAAAKELVTSTYQPTHSYGVQVYPDGVSWLMAQDLDICYNAGVRNVHCKDIFYDREELNGFVFNFDDDNFSRSVYPGSMMPVFDGITMEGLQPNGNTLTHFATLATPFKDLRIVNSRYNCLQYGIYIRKDASENFVESNLLLIGASFNLDNNNKDIIYCDNDRSVKAKYVASMKHGSATPTYTGANVAVDSDLD